MTASERGISLADLEAFDPGALLGGRERRFCCPFPTCAGKPTDASHRSLSLNMETGAFVCHRCHTSGLLKDRWSTSRVGAGRRRTALRAFSLPPERKEPAPRPGVSAFRLELTDLRTGPGARYLQRRCIDLLVAKIAGVHYSTSWFGRPAVLFPIQARTGEIIAWQGRHIDGGEPRMHDDGPKSAGLFASPGAMDNATPLVFVEAPLDALSLATCGIPAFASCGTSWPEWLPRLVAFRSVALAFDADAAGDGAAASLTPLLISFGANVRRWRPAGTKDWNEALCCGEGMPCWQCATTGDYAYVPAHLMTDSSWTCGKQRHASSRIPVEIATTTPNCASSHRADVSESARRLERESYSALRPSAESFHSPYPRCRLCGHGLSVVAVRDICGRCALHEVMRQLAADRSQSADLEDERHLRGRVLAALDRRNYPRLQLPDHVLTGPGVEGWAPVLREMNLPQLRSLLRLVERQKP